LRHGAAVFGGGETGAGISDDPATRLKTPLADSRRRDYGMAASAQPGCIKGIQMRIRIVVGAVVGFMLSHTALPAQDSGDLPRVRITAPATYEIPGLIKAEGDRLTGTFTPLDKTMVQVASANGSEPLVMPRPGKRIVGQVVGTGTDVLLFRRDGGSHPLTIPVAAIERYEISQGPRATKRMRFWASFGAGLGAGLAAAAMADSMCDRSFTGGSIGPCAGTFTWGVATGVGSGLVTRWLLGRDRWVTVSRERFISSQRETHVRPSATN
jgi:hypothetical protein